MASCVVSASYFGENCALVDLHADVLPMACD